MEHSAENLQFYLWLQDYTRRFHEAPSFDRDLSPEWTTDDQTRALRRARADARKASRVTPISSSLAQLAAIDRFSSDVKPLESSATSVVEPDNLNPFGTPPDTPSMPPNTVHASISLSDIPANGPRSTTASFRTGVSKDESLYTGFSASSATSESFTNVGLAKPCKRIYPSLPFPQTNIDQSPSNHFGMRSNRLSPSTLPTAPLANST